MYRIKGSDGKEYGPISADQIRQWVAENRLNRDSVAASDADPAWKPLGQFPEFAGLFPAGAPSALGSVPTMATGSGQPVWDAASARENARKVLQAPATALIVIGLLSCVVALLRPFLKRQMMEFIMSASPQLDPNMRQGIEAALQAPVGVADIVGAVVSLGLNVLIVVGAMRMRQVRSYGLAMTSAILAVIPCCTCCCIGIPFGIWALVLLNRAEVKRAFQQTS